MIYRTNRRQTYRTQNPETGLAVIRLAVTALAVVLAPVTVIAGLAAYARGDRRQDRGGAGGRVP